MFLLLLFNLFSNLVLVMLLFMEFDMLLFSSKLEDWEYKQITSLKKS